jgi:hypothetical protein
VNVTASILHGGICSLSTRYAILWTSTLCEGLREPRWYHKRVFSHLVLPDPGPATTRMCCRGAKTAARCEGLSCCAKRSSACVCIARICVQRNEMRVRGHPIAERTLSARAQDSHIIACIATAYRYRISTRCATFHPTSLRVTSPILGTLDVAELLGLLA